MPGSEPITPTPLEQLNARPGRIPGFGYVHEVEAVNELVAGAFMIGRGIRHFDAAQAGLVTHD